MDLDYEIDGVVIKLNDATLYDDLGSTSKFPRWAIAYKFPAEIKETKLLKIFPTVGRTGRITYNAGLEPVILLGTKITAATLHNANYIRSLDLRINDIVKVKKAGDIIPKVLEVVISKRESDSIE
jgi:DNA ligase (NAD+)